MANANGRMTAILYTRVSGDEQKKRGFSLSDQRDALRVWATENGHEVIEEVEDGGYSGAYLERPGLDRVRELVRAGKAGAVVVLFRDRIARGIHAQLLAEEFRQNGARLVALNSRGDDSPDGELGDNILDVISGWERKKIAERMNRGKIRKAREGKIVAGPSPNYGYRFNQSRDGYEVDEEKMVVVRRIFEMMGSQGKTKNSVRRALENEGIPSPSGSRRWSKQFLRRLILDDVYLSRTFEEIAEMVSPEVASRLDPDRVYGVWWYGKERHTHSQERVNGANGVPQYRRVKKSVPVPEGSPGRVAVPVPDSGVPREWVLNARRAIENNTYVSNAGYRVWQLTGGIIRCPECGRGMGTNAVVARGNYYYRCANHYNGGLEACSANHYIRADNAEAQVWELVRSILTDPERLAAGLEKMHENEVSGVSERSSAEEEETSWLKRLSEIERKEERLLDLHLEGDITTEQFRAKRTTLQEARDAATDSLKDARSRQARLEEFRHDKDALIEHYARLVPEDLDSLTPEERRTLYRMMHLTVWAATDKTLTAEWGFCNDEPTLPGSGRTRGR